MRFLTLWAELLPGVAGMSIKPTSPICSIIIPAYNEESCISTTLNALTKGMKTGEFEIIVVCNGCQDNTAAAARSACELARVLETHVASKTNALNIGIKEATCDTIVFLDADIKTSAASVRLLLRSLAFTNRDLAYGKAIFSTRKCSAPVKSFYKAWRLNPYFDGGKVGGFFAVSKLGLSTLGEFPHLTNDDEYVRRKLAVASVYVPAATYTVEPPRTLSSLIKVRSRVYRGNQELSSLQIQVANNQQRANGRRFLRRLANNPSAWAGAFVFALVATAAHLRNRVRSYDGEWEQDPTARTAQG